MDSITESPGRYWPVSRKYDTKGRKYEFFKVIHASCLQDYYPLLSVDRTSSFWRDRANSISQTSVEHGVDFTTDSNMKKEALVTMDDLSNDIMLIIFGYFHPIDLIHSLSLVCRRWNYLANHPAFFTEIRVLVNDCSLNYGSVKGIFHRASQHLRKLCIDCSVPLPSAQVNALFDVCFPNVTHLDIGTFREMNTTLLEILSNCFPNVETLHMEGVNRRPQNEEDWNKTVKLLFDDVSIFPKMKNLFMADLSEYCRGSDERLSGYCRPLNILYIFNGAAKINFSDIRNSPWKSTLTELHLGYSIENEDFRYIGDLQNLKILSLAICLYAFDEEIAPLKNLYNLEELRIDYGGEDCNLTNDGMISLFTLPECEPEKAFPYKLKHLGITDFQGCSSNLLKAVNNNCPYLRTLDLSFSEYMDDDALPFIVANFKHLVFLDLSNLGECYKDEVWSNLNDKDLPELRFLKIHGNEADIGNLQRLNLKRPKLLISTKLAYVINWTVNENGYVFHDTFDGDIKALENDLRQIEGLRDFKIT